MKKMLFLSLASALALMGCDSKAQNQTSMDVGNPDSSNLLIIEQGYEAVAPVMVPAPSSQNSDGTVVEGVSTDDVEVSPLDTSSPAAQVAPMPNNMNNGTSINIQETETPNSYEFEETETNN